MTKMTTLCQAVIDMALQDGLDLNDMEDRMDGLSEAEQLEYYDDYKIESCDHYDRTDYACLQCGCELSSRWSE